MKPTVVGLILLLTTSGCVTREVIITGVCADASGAPRKGIVVTGKEIRGSWLALFGPVLPEIRPLTTATSDDSGKFSLQLRSTRHLLLDIKDPSEKGAFDGRARVTVPESGKELSLSVITEDGYLTGQWQK